MIYLGLSILSSTGIFLVFKFLGQKRLPPFPVIIINYLTASILGLLGIGISALAIILFTML
jgi:hypothetical protein